MFKKSVIQLVLISFCLLATTAISQDLSEVFQSFEYRNIGPNRGGRVTTVTGIESLPGTFFMGASGGGVWKTTDYGVSWKNVSDGFFITPSIGAIRVSKSNPEIVYVGTGSDGLRSNVITGKGVYKSADGGETWTHIGLKKAGQIGAVEIHPSNPDIVFVAAIGQAFQPNKERGVYKSSDGGESWEQVLYHSDTVGAVDIEFAPDNPDIMYASLWRGERKPWTIISGGMKSGGIYKSEDGGNTWVKKEKGLPDGLIGKADLAVSAADPSRLYAIIEAPPKQGGLYRSDDRGESFVMVSDRKELVNRPFYYTNVDANPLNADIIISNANPGMISRDAGKTWTRIKPPHGDNHDVWINPADTSIWIQANDGGANITTNGGKTWSLQSIQPTSELYQVEVDDQYPYWLYAGQQDNTTISVPSQPPYIHPAGGNGYWRAVGGCETGPAVPKPGNANIVYSNCKGRFGVYNKTTGQERQYYVGASNIYGHNPKDLKFRFQRVAPIHVSPHNPDVVYHTSQYVHKTTDDGESWEIISPDLTAFEADKQVVPGTPITRDVTGEEYYSTIYAIQESKVAQGMIWVGANDGPVHVTRNGGKDWTDVTPDIPKGGRVDCVEPSPHNQDKAYVAVLRYQLGDYKPYILKTTDGGKNWSLLTDGSNGIPADYPTRVVREDPVREGVLYAGTEFGMFVSLDDGNSWKAFQQNLPVTPITDIKIHRNDLVLSTMGRGFWVLDNISTLHQVAEVAPNDQVQLYKPKSSVRYNYRNRDKREVPNYPDPGIDIDYYLPKEIKETITLDILNDKGQVVSSFTSEKPKNESSGETDMSTGFFSQASRPGLDNKKGMNRVRWDMRHIGAWSSNAKRAFLNGPMASPGNYTVRLSASGKQYSKDFSLLINPNLDPDKVTLEDITKQEELALKVKDLLDKSRRLEDSLKKRLADEKNKSVVKKLEDIKAGLSTAEGIYMQPMLVDQTRYLLNMLNQADQLPGKDAYDRYEELSENFSAIREKWDRLN